MGTGRGVIGSIAWRRALATSVLAAALFLALLLALPPSGAGGSARAPEGEDWQGLWSTSGIHGQIRLDQDGDHVTGKYPGRKGKLKGSADGNSLEGTYDCDGEGRFEIHFVRGTRHQQFKGEYKPDGKRWKEWEGHRQ